MLKQIITITTLFLMTSSSLAEPRFIFRVKSGGDFNNDQQTNANIILNVPSSTVGTPIPELRAQLSDNEVAPVWQLTGSLPDGISFLSDGSFVGTPTNSGAFNFSLIASVDNNVRASRSFTWNVSQAQSSLRLTESNYSGRTGNTEIFQLAATGGTAPYSFSVVSGNIPNGLQLEDFYIYGIPTAMGNYPLTIQITDNNGVTGTHDIEIDISKGIVISKIFADGYVGENYVGEFRTDDPETMTWNNMGNIPGLTWNNNIISGIPSTAGSYTLSTTAVLDEVQQTDSVNVRIYDALRLQESSRLSPSYVGESATAAPISMTMVGGRSPFTWAISDYGNISQSTSMIGVTNGARLNTKPSTPGEYNFTASVTDRNGKVDSKNFTFEIVAAIGIISGTTTWTPNFIVNQNVNYQFMISNGGKAPFTWTISGGSLPNGVTLNSETGVLSGTPTTVGNNNFVVRVTDANNRTRVSPTSYNMNVSN